MTDWIETAKELPPCDGWYEIKPHSFLERFDVPSNAYYDGYFFRNMNTLERLYTPSVWRHCEQPKKRYGVIKCPPN